MKQDFKQQTIIVQNKVGRVKNPYRLIPKHQSLIQPDYTSKELENNKQYNDFEQYAKQTAFATDAVDGEYLGEEFGEEVWQKLYRARNEWFNVDEIVYHIHAGSFDGFECYFKGLDIDTRKFRPFIGTQPIN